MSGLAERHKSHTYMRYDWDVPETAVVQIPHTKIHADAFCTQHCFKD